MKIGVLTYYRIANFGANLQALSTYMYLNKHGHEPFFIDYNSQEGHNKNDTTNIQVRSHLNFIDKYIVNQSTPCNNITDVLNYVKAHHINGIIVGADAVLQHHPFFDRIKKGKRKPFYIEHVSSDRMYPNAFWGEGLSDMTPMALMSVSSQNTNYHLIPFFTKLKMYKSLSKFKYISVRDDWTKKMLLYIGIDKQNIHMTPDPVFNFNENASVIIPDERSIRNKFNIKRDYVLISLFEQCISYKTLCNIEKMFKKINIDCYALTMPNGINFKHPLKEIQIPLLPHEWYSLIKYSKGYIGSNMHPIVVALHNCVPCYSIDNWGRTDFFGKKINDHSSKVEDILKIYGLSKNKSVIQNGVCNVSAEEVFNSILNFPLKKVKDISDKLSEEYKLMMNSVLKSISESCNIKNY